MTRDLQSYPAYKDSGVPWLGEVPEHWEVLPNRAIFVEIKERDHPEADMLSVTITNGVVRQQTLLDGSSKKDSSNLDKSAYKLVRRGDIVYNKMRAWQGAVGMSDYEGIVSPAYVVQRPREGGARRYLHYLLRTPAFAKEAERWSYGITSDMWSLRPEHFRMIYSCLPPIPEQAAIVRFLDYTDRRIRRYIRARQKLIKLLEEQKQAIIHRAVTRGLDPNVRLKPSGVEWLGDVPEHWDCMKVGYFAEVGNGSTPSRSRADYWSDGTHAWLNSSVANNSEVFESDQFVTETALAECHLPRLGPGDVLIAITGQGKTRAKATVLGIEATINQHLAYVRLRSTRVRPHFLQLVITVGYQHLRSISDDSGSTKGALTCADIRQLKVPLPSREEQGRIVDWGHRATADTDLSIDVTRRQISLLREYRARLIADVVTGKLDVRAAAARLPEELPEEEEQAKSFDETAAVGDADDEPTDVTEESED